MRDPVASCCDGYAVSELAEKSARLAKLCVEIGNNRPALNAPTVTRLCGAI
jgi:hypothetical protein